MEKSNTSKFKVGDAVQLIDKPFNEYSKLVLSSMFLGKISGQKFIVVEAMDEDGDYLLQDMNGRLLWLNDNDLEPWEGIY